MNVNDEYDRRGLRRQLGLGVSDTFRPIITRSRHTDSNIDWAALPVESVNLVDPETGKFWFVVGVSTVGGGDRVRP